MGSQNLRELLTARNISEAKLYFTNPEYKQDLSENVDEILNCIVELMNDEKTTSEDFLQLTQWLKILCSCTKPKEMLLFLLEHFEQSSLLHLLSPIKDVLLLMPEKRGASLEWVLNTFWPSVRKLQLPGDYNLEGEERKLLDFDSEVAKITDALPFYVDFLQAFVFEVSLGNTSQLQSGNWVLICRERSVLKEFIMNLFGHPLAYLDLHNEPPDAKSNARVLAEKLFGFLIQIEGNFLNLYNHSNTIFLPYEKVSSTNALIPELVNGLSEKDQLSILSTAVVAYFLLAENTGVTLNMVYSANFLLQQHLKHVIVLLLKTENVIVHKGMILLNILLLKTPQTSLSIDLLDVPETVAAIRCLFNIMVNCQVKELREMGLSSFKLIVKKFKPQARARLLVSLIQILNHSGSKGVVIQLYKDEVHAEIRENKSDIFFGNSLVTFVSYATLLPNDVETDILDNSDSILQALNFLRYIYQVDGRNINRTGAWRVVDRIKNKMLVPLRTGLELSKAHYELELKKLSENRSRKSSSVNNTSVCVAGTPLPNMSRKQEMEMYNSALVYFDMMESVLVRVEELIQ